MDELDRMFRRLVHNVRAGFPDLLGRSFEVSSLYQTLIPYRLNRGELGIDSVEEYELTLLRLLAGTRGLLNGDPDMQAALQSELESPNPDLSIFRVWATASISINAMAVRALDSQSTVAVRAPSPVSTRQAEMAGRATLELATATVAPPLASPAPHVATAARASAPVATPPELQRAAATPVSASSHTHGPGCRYCGGELPDAREAHFCPHCGQNLSVKQCPACSTELEVEWQFCITCGRQSE
jgi:hypothetical protein